MSASSLFVTHRITIPESELDESFIRSSGPGGQNVNKVSSAVQLRFDVLGSPSLTDVAREALLRGGKLTRDGVPYEVGVARYREIARGQIIGDTVGMLKLLFHSETRQLLGVHVIGEGATELVHIGQAVMAHGGKLDYFIDTVFNYPTLAECYKVAALAALNKFSSQSASACAVA